VSSCTQPGLSVEADPISTFLVIYATYLQPFCDLLKVMGFQQSKAPAIAELNTIQEYDLLASQELTIIFKHSPTCPTSLFAHREVSRFCERQPDAPVYLISVRRQRDIACHIAQRTGVRHESPQVVVLSHGDVRAAASHGAITAEWIASAVASCSVAM
jgi:bacillithiol system protein YtxJ